MVVSDPPWLRGFEDLRSPFGETIARILRPGGFAAVYCGHFHLKEFMDALCEAGLDYRWLIACVNEGSMGAIRSSASISRSGGPCCSPRSPEAGPKPHACCGT